jgi:hypothetical protein
VRTRAANDDIGRVDGRVKVHRQLSWGWFKLSS